MKKSVIPFILVTFLILVGFLARSFVSGDGNETLLESLQLDASAEDTSAKTDLLILVNKDNKLPDDYQVNLSAVGDVKVASVLVDDLKRMRDAAERDDVQLYIDNAYRTTAEQEQMFNDAVSAYSRRGSPTNTLISSLAAHPGYSEHETGLAIDFSFDGSSDKQSEMWEWLSENAHEYGFILRYPEDKRPITGYKFEPWHYRYVGKEHAKAMSEHGLTLEEYLM